MDEYADIAMYELAVELLAEILSCGDKKLRTFLRNMFAVFAKYEVPASKWAMLLNDIGEACELNNREYDEDGVSLGCQE